MSPTVAALLVALLLLVLIEGGVIAYLALRVSRLEDQLEESARREGQLLREVEALAKSVDAYHAEIVALQSEVRRLHDVRTG